MSDDGLLARLHYEGVFGVECIDCRKRATDKTDVFDTLDVIAEQIKTCEQCDLCRTRTRTVAGEGSPDADVMFVGEAPGRDEDVQGRPFVGRAGRLLDRMMAAIGLDRTKAYIANVVKCRPPENRAPLPSEMMACLPYLRRQIEVIDPRVICVMGGVAAGALIESDVRITRIRGQRFEIGGRIVIAIYHPAYLLRNPAAKKETWEDLQMLQGVLDSGVERG